MTPGKLSLILAVVLVTFVASVFSLVGITPAADPKSELEIPPGARPKPGPADHAEFMRRKLQSSAKILEGLTTENMDLIQTGARELSKMSTSEKWRVHTSAMYQQFSGEFQRNTNDLIKAAEAGNLDQAALKWMATTMSCLDCHRYVRNELMVK